eukprot:TRINITY_DN8403_c0_g1_i1.p1 TRINITY_DN8403_c0_g1~~TRINITY_DN8403_c0_g1_i1.p1  ORF type:complete len:200 (-),score=58.36 TRINITY_DN8403_c0_g1_i1:11-610(-)
MDQMSAIFSQNKKVILSIGSLTVFGIALLLKKRDYKNEVVDELIDTIQDSFKDDPKVKHLKKKKPLTCDIPVFGLKDLLVDEPIRVPNHVMRKSDVQASLDRVKKVVYEQKETIIFQENDIDELETRIEIAEEKIRENIRARQNITRENRMMEEELKLKTIEKQQLQKYKEELVEEIGDMERKLTPAKRLDYLLRPNDV